MKKKFLFGVIAILYTLTGHAHEFKNTQFHVEHPWARPTFALATTGAAYLSIENVGKGDQRLVGASVASTIADEVQLHDVIMDGEMMKMRQITTGVSLAENEKVNFTPGGKHMMLLGLKGPLNEGESFPLTLHFESSETMVVTINIEKPKQEAVSHAHHH